MTMQDADPSESTADVQEIVSPNSGRVCQGILSVVIWTIVMVGFITAVALFSRCVMGWGG